VVDPEDLVFSQGPREAGVQRTRGFQAVAERLFDHDTAPESRLSFLILALIGKFRGAQLLDHGAEKTIGDREREEDGVRRSAGGPAGLIKSGAIFFVERWVVQIA
jgi:hypothetical protein